MKKKEKNRGVQKVIGLTLMVYGVYLISIELSTIKIILALTALQSLIILVCPIALILFLMRFVLKKFLK